MGQTAHRYFIFEAASGFCGIAWNNAGITRFQLPTRSAEAAVRILLRRLPGAEPGAPTPEVVETIAAAKRYFAGEETDFSALKLDLGERTRSSRGSTPRRAGSDGAIRPPTARWRRSSAPGRKSRAMSARPWRAIRWR